MARHAIGTSSVRQLGRRRRNRRRSQPAARGRAATRRACPRRHVGHHRVAGAAAGDDLREAHPVGERHVTPHLQSSLFPETFEPAHIVRRRSLSLSSASGYVISQK